MIDRHRIAALKRRTPRAVTWFLRGAPALCFSGCLTQDVVIRDPAVHVTTIAVSLIPDTLYGAAAAALGWTKGVPNLELTVLRDDSAQTVVATAHTDADGRIQIGPLEPGWYVFAATRVLTEAELRAVAGTDIEGYVIHNPIRLAQTDTATVMLYASRRGSVITSEWAFQSGYYGQFGYEVGGFLEVYSNADTTVYLDGLTIADGFSFAKEIAGSGRCAYNAKNFIEPTAVWAWRFDWFPGRGRDFPLAPGKTAVIATDAIDHRPLFQNAIDLRNADFEFHGPSDVDNPVVPNMINSGLADYRPGHGENFGNTDAVVVLARPLTLADLPQRISDVGLEYRRIAVTDLIDVIALQSLPTYLGVRCAHMIDPAILADDAWLLGVGTDPFQLSVNRRVLYVRSDGRKVLQNSRSSVADLILGPRTPGVIP